MQNIITAVAARFIGWLLHPSHNELGEGLGNRSSPKPRKWGCCCWSRDTGGISIATARRVPGRNQPAIPSNTHVLPCHDQCCPGSCHCKSKCQQPVSNTAVSPINNIMDYWCIELTYVYIIPRAYSLGPIMMYSTRMRMTVIFHVAREDTPMQSNARVKS